jgi:ketosteroid isomerase-like protein
MSRSPQEVFQHHAEVLIAGDLEGIVSDYSDDAVFISPNGFIEWSAHADKTFVEDGIDTFVFRDGEIVVQTVRYTLQQK